MRYKQTAPITRSDEALRARSTSENIVTIAKNHGDETQRLAEKLRRRKMPLIGQNTQRHGGYPEDGQAERETADMAERVDKRPENQDQKEAAGENRRSGAFSKWLQQQRDKQSDQQRWIAHSGARGRQSVSLGVLGAAASVQIST